MTTTSPGRAARSLSRSRHKRLAASWRIGFTLLLLGAACAADEPEPATDVTPSATTVSEAALPVGRYTAKLTRSDFSDLPFAADKRFFAEWSLTIAEDVYVLDAPVYRVTESLGAIDGSTLQITATPAPTGAFNCVDAEGERTTVDGSASGTYAYVLSGKAFTLDAEEEPCPLRQAILEREWRLDG
ncbi:MAG: hypothetical protein H0U53_09530 [Actinobacteria bacterium]|nr:hypothetical protein [Actinomycetota bacterium]